jgi:hypothetical protein
MAKSKYRTALVEGEVSIQITPRGTTAWVGTARQLAQEIYIPSDLSWPIEIGFVDWQADGWKYRIYPERKAGLFRLERTLAAHYHQSGMMAIIFEKESELKAAQRSFTEQGCAEWLLYDKARMDKKFKAFKTMIFASSEVARG